MIKNSCKSWLSLLGLSVAMTLVGCSNIPSVAEPDATSNHIIIYRLSTNQHPVTICLLSARLTTQSKTCVLCNMTLFALPPKLAR